MGKVAMKACTVCGEAFDAHTAVAGTPEKVEPSVGSILCCGGCGVLYKVDEGMVLRRVELEQLDDMPAEQKGMLASAQAFLRERAKHRMPPGYVKAIERAERLIRGWLEQHRKEERPRLRLSDSAVLVIAPLDALVDRVAGNVSAKQMLGYLLRLEPELTVFMLRVAAERIGLPVVSVSLGELGLKVGQS